MRNLWKNNDVVEFAVYLHLHQVYEDQTHQLDKALPFNQLASVRSPYVWKLLKKSCLASFSKMRTAAQPKVAEKNRERLDWQSGLDSAWGPKPKGMRWRTYERLFTELDEWEQASDDGFMVELILSI